MEEIGEKIPHEPPVDAAMEAAMSLEPMNTRGQIVGLGVAGLRAVHAEPEAPAAIPKPKVFPGEANYISTADRLRARELKDSHADERRQRQQTRRRGGRR